MEHLDKVKTISFLRPNAKFVLRGETIEWLDEIQTEPTEAEIKTGFVSYKKAQDAELKTKDQAKAAAQSKLAALGLTVEDLQALGL